MSEKKKTIRNSLSLLKTAQEIGLNYADKTIPGMQKAGKHLIGTPAKIAFTAYDIKTSAETEGVLQATCTNIAQHAAGAT